MKINKIIFTCKEADCSKNCKIIMNVPSYHQIIYDDVIDDIENHVEFPKVCPFNITHPIWKYEGSNFVKYKVDEKIVHG